MPLAANLLLALIWAGLVGEVTVSTLLTGFVLGYLCLLCVYRGPESSGEYFRKFPRVVGFVIYYLYELVKSNVIISIDILSPKNGIQPGIIAIPLGAKTDLEITMFANLISMTPGTLSLDVSDDRKTLFVHAMYVEDADVLRDEIKDSLERRVLEILR